MAEAQESDQKVKKKKKRNTMEAEAQESSPQDSRGTTRGHKSLVVIPWRPQLGLSLSLASPTCHSSPATHNHHRSLGLQRSTPCLQRALLL
ncbi:hypothetical protein RchiOBHm_Chr6g0283361 [Rosa chinensis]|uniref:Uncharacterized protein n=1 Tax=Rosa chinensis TaxID=74649 RepID=A0A2P6PU29_ROSCH|nr:hypothetical protein RchiOBHm_Chr6g0283361 [Rosa chinensis]